MYNSPRYRVSQNDTNNDGWDDDQPPPNSEVPQPGVVKGGAEGRSEAIIANTGQEKGQDDQNLRLHNYNEVVLYIR